jgi:predicted  nucleic acid-binding Zn-ribbon protein
MNTQIISDKFHHITQEIRIAERDRASLAGRLDQTNRRIDRLVTALDILGAAVADLERRFNDHRHPVMENVSMDEVAALTGFPVRVPDKPGEPA